MTREEAKELLPIIQAFAEGKTIQSKQINASDKGWRNIEECNFLKGLSYRIKPEPKYCPFKTKEECFKEIMKHNFPQFIIRNKEKDIFTLSYIYNEGIYIDGIFGEFTFQEAFEKFSFADGTPFGVKEE